MDDHQFKHISAINYWEQPPQRLGYQRINYIEQIIRCCDNNLLKVLIGQRRSGKSHILKQVIAELISKGISAENILYLNFELHQLQSITTSDTLNNLITLFYERLKPTGKVFLFFDEIQEVEGWEKVVNSYLANERYEVEVFITGSNAHLLSTELSTYVTGRYIEIPIFPFSFIEYCTIHNYEQSRTNLIAYIEDSGIPELNNLQDNRQKISYLMALKDSILINDVIKRFQIKNPKLLSLLVDFIIDNIGRLFSINAVVKKLKACGITTNAVTIGNYLNYIELTLMIHSVPRYDLRGKKILEGEKKYYLNDLGFANYLQSTFDNGITRKLENYVYLALIQHGYTVYVGNIHTLEIDFVAEKNKKKFYIQVCYLLQSPNVINREYGNLEKISDHWPKYVVTLDEVSFPPKNGILHLPVWKLDSVLLPES